MRRNQQPNFLMPDMASGLPPSDVENSSVWRRPCIRHVLADNHPLELQDGDPALADLVELVGKDAMTAFGQFVGGGFRMVELLGLVDDPCDQIQRHIVNDLQPVVPVLPLVSTETKLAANALVTLALRGLGATVCGPYEDPIFLKPTDRIALQELGQTLHSVPGVREVLENGLWWTEVPALQLDIHDPDGVWDGFTPDPHSVVDLFLQ